MVYLNKHKKTMSISIRKYNKQDKQECLEAFKCNVPLYFTEDEIGDFENFLQKIESLNAVDANIKTYYFVIIFEEKIIGCGGFGDKDGKDIVSLAWGFIQKNYHKKGFGKELLLYRLKQIEQLYPNLPVVIDTTQFSFEFFIKFGFNTTKITKDYYAKGLDRCDMILNK